MKHILYYTIPSLALLLFQYKALAMTETTNAQIKSTIDLARITSEEGWQLLRKYADRVDEYDRLDLDGKKLMRREFWEQAKILFENGTSLEDDKKAVELRHFSVLLREITPETWYIHLTNLEEMVRAVEESSPDLGRMWYRGNHGSSFKDPDFMRSMQEKEAGEKPEEYAELMAQVSRNIEVRNEKRRILAEYEPYIVIENELRRLRGILWAMDDDYMYYLIEKYKGWTEEERRQREMELMYNHTKNEEEKREERELGGYSIASYNASVPHNEKTDVFIAPDTKEYVEVQRALREIEQILGRMRSAMVFNGNEGLMRVLHKLVDIIDGEIRIPPDTEEYRNLCNELDKVVYRADLTDEDMEQIKKLVENINQLAKTNSPTSVLQVSKEAKERLQEYPKRNEERQRLLRRLQRIVDAP